MKQEYIELGSAPYNEDCAQVGTPNYAVNARRECQHYITAIRNYLGMEPDGAHLAVKSFPHDYGTYYETVCYYDPEDQAAVEYAFRCEGQGPATWEDGSVKAPPLEKAVRTR